MNSPQDDFATSLTSESSGFFSSNRINGAGKDDIYAFALHEKPVIPLIPIALVPATPKPIVPERKQDSILH